jgi:hypothetical protein
MRILIARHKAKCAGLFLKWRQVSQGDELKLDDTVVYFLGVRAPTFDMMSRKSL